MTTALADFDYEVTTTSPGRNLPQKMGSRLWLPMFVMAIMGFAIGIGFAVFRSAEIADRVGFDPATAQSLKHLTTAFMFIGFLGVFTAISFAIAKILGEFRTGGGEVQEAARAKVHTLRMPATAKILMVSMMMGMMALLGAIVLHFVAAAVYGDPGDLVRSEQWFTALEGVRRLGVALYLFGIAFGLGTIIQVLRFQAIRVRQLPQATRSTGA